MTQQGFSNINKRKLEATQTQHMEGAIDLMAYVNQINQQTAAAPKPIPKNKLAGSFSVKNEVEVS